MPTHAAATHALSHHMQTTGSAAARSRHRWNTLRQVRHELDLCIDRWKFSQLSERQELLKICC
jgi:hypothetical protein